MEAFTRGSVIANGLVFPFIEHGEGPLVLCMHGFPDTPRTFRHQLRSLAAAGHRVVAPYMRGYAQTNQGGPYQAAAFGRDVVALIEALGHQDAVVVGHDWGTSAAYAAALHAPERVKGLVAAAVPYGFGMGQALVMNAAQQRRSWYMFFLQTRLADLAVPLSDFAFIDALYADWSPGYTPPREEIAAVKAALAAPGVLEAALAYYRTVFGVLPRAPELEAEESRINADPISVPTLYLHGENDGCVGIEVTLGMEAMFMAEFRKVVVPGAGHFLHQEQPGAFDAAVLDFIGRR